MMGLRYSPLGFLEPLDTEHAKSEEEESERTTGSEGEGEQAFQRAWRTRPEQLW